MIEKIIYSIVVFGLLVMFHEFGHFSVAKLTGVGVYEFSIGFGPRLGGFRRKETLYSIRAIPLGGFVKMAGMDPEEDHREGEKTVAAAPLDPRKSFMNKSVPARMAIIAAGPIMNFVLAILLFASSFLIFGVPANKNVVGDVIQGRPAAEAGIQKGDVITRIDGAKIATWEDILNKVHPNAEKEISVEVKRNDQTKVIRLVPEKDPQDGFGKIGITYLTERLGLFESLKLGAVKTYQMLELTVYFLGQMIAKEVPVELSGPVRITYELGKAVEMGFIYLINIAGFLSIQIGLFNLLPIPALDGSRLIFLGWEGVRGTPIDPNKENFVHMVGLALLLSMVVVITYFDIVGMLS